MNFRSLRPTAPLVLPGASEAIAWARRTEDENPAAFVFESVLVEPIGWFLLRKYLAGLGNRAELLLDFIADVQSYQSISTPSLRLSRAADIVATYFGTRYTPNTPQQSANVSDEAFVKYRKSARCTFFFAAGYD
jgi:hypothetical protein